MIFGGSQYFFRRELSEVSKNERMKFIALKTKDGQLIANIALEISACGGRCHGDFSGR